ncbi:hypothetical protein ES703_40762 [subsurface metagenome]
MSRQSRPTAEELKFVYGLILSGYADSDVLEEYDKLYKSGQLMWPFRTDKRFVRERRKELAAAEEILKEHLKKLVDPVIVQTKREHFERLAQIAQLLVQDGLDKIYAGKSAETYDIDLEGYETEVITHNQLIGRLEANIDAAIQKHGHWLVWESFANHLKAESTKIESTDLYQFANDNPLELIALARLLYQRQTFKGTCPVCEGWL